MPGTSPLKQLWLQILIATPVGVALGHFAPTTGADMKPLGDAFIALIRMMIGPAIFGTVVHGGAGMDDMKRVGRAAAQAARLVRSDDDAGARARRRRDAEARRRHEHRPATDLETAKQQSVNGYLLHVIPTTVFSALSGSEVAWKRRIDKTDRTIDRGFLEGAWRKNMFWMLRISVISSC